MTREEARQIIATWLVSSKGTKGQRGYIEGWFDEEDVEAFRMAIEALKIDMMEVVRCKDCHHANECHKKIQYTRNEPNSVTIGFLPIEWCSRGERREE